MVASEEGTPEASPQMVRSLEVTENAWDQMQDEFGLLTSRDVSDLTGLTTEEIFDKHVAGELFCVVRKGRWLYPAFQFEPASGAIRPVVADLIKAAEDSSRSESGLALWMVTPTGYLDGSRPVDCLDYPDTVLIAAKASFGVQW